ncbi:MAG: hypothetical protein IJR46_05790 [Neisseriaceae bacterium]|nr:hypothetical protein [Neisseriaceae bacterium]MBR0212495.1 hypothetical protein [Alphaproteobacteria bacterium]
MSDLDDFKVANKPNGRVSKIEPYKDDVLDLKSNGYSTTDVVKYLKEYKNMSISAQAVNNFLKKIKGTGKSNTKTTKTIQKTNKHLSGSLNDKKENRQPETFVLDKTPLSELLK